VDEELIAATSWSDSSTSVTWRFISATSTGSCEEEVAMAKKKWTKADQEQYERTMRNAQRTRELAERAQPNLDAKHAAEGKA
jgi:hypothetical protein